MANLQTTTIQGNTLTYDAAVHTKRFVHAIGPDVIQFFDDFLSLPVDDTTGDPSAYTATVVEVGAGDSTATSANVTGGGLLLTTAANENDGINLQLKGEGFKLISGQPLYFGATVKINDVTQSDLFIGLAITDTDILGGVTDRIGFQSVDADAGLDFAVEKDSTETLTEDVGTLVDATKHTIEFYWNGSSLEVFFDGASAATPATTNLPDDEELCFTVQFLTGEAVAQTCEIDWVRIIQIGGRA